MNNFSELKTMINAHVSKCFLKVCVHVGKYFLVTALLMPIGFCQDDYQNHIKNFLQHNFANNHVGLIVQDLQNNKTIYQHNPHKLFIPASLLKLFTLATSLEGLSANFKFKTSIKWDPKTLGYKNTSGDLAMIFTGDPSLHQQDLEKMILLIKTNGINTINGDLIIDDTLFSDLYGVGWSQEDLGWYFAAPSGAIVVAENSIPISIKPITTIGQKVEFNISEEKKFLYPLTVRSQVIAVTQQQSDTDCQLLVNINSDNVVSFSGCAQVDERLQKLKVALHAPRKYLKNFLLDHLKENGIKLTGDVAFKKAPENLHTTLAAHYSAPLHQLLKTMMDDSNNVYAHSISKALGAKLYADGSFKTATKAMLDILQKKFTVNTSTLRIVDSSGLSSYNVVAPNHIIRLLQAIYDDNSLKKQVFHILSKSGQNGLLKNRLAARDLKGKILAKTGTLKNASGLSGYVVTKTGKQIAFVMMVNNITQDILQIKRLEDELCEFLVNAG